jgi:hypothetical protein
MTSEEQLRDENNAMRSIMLELAATASRTSASYEYEIDVLRAALKRLYNYYSDVSETGESPSPSDWLDAWSQAWDALACKGRPE